MFYRFLRVKKWFNADGDSGSLAQASYPPLWLRKLPNRLTLLRILSIPVVVYLMGLGEVVTEDASFWLPISPLIPAVFDKVAAIVFALAAMTDFFDGWIARKFGIESLLGKLLDPLADKLLVVSAMVILVEKHRLCGTVAVMIIVRDLGINAIRLAAHEDGIQIASNFIGKTKTALQGVGIVGLIVGGFIWYIPFHLIGHLCMLLALGASLVSGGQYLFSYARALRDREKEPNTTKDKSS